MVILLHRTMLILELSILFNKLSKKYLFKGDSTPLNLIPKIFNTQIDTQNEL